MDTRNAVVEMWINAGEPSDLDPFQAAAPSYDVQYLDPASYGVTHYLRELSDAQTMLANWKTRRGRPVRFDKFMTQRNVKIGLTDDLKKYTATLLDEYTIRIDNPPAWLTPDKLESSRCTVVQDDETDTLMAMIVDYDVSGALDIQFRDALTTVVSPTLPPTVEFEMDRFVIEAVGGIGNGSAMTMPVTFRNINKLTTAEGGGSVTRVEEKEDLYNAQLTSGTPSQWYALGDRVFFDVYVEDPQWLVVEYQRLPAEVTSLDGLIDIPAQWHLILILIAEWKSAKRLQDLEKESILLSKLNGMIEQFRLDNEEDFLREETGNMYVRKEAR